MTHIVENSQSVVFLMSASFEKMEVMGSVRKCMKHCQEAVFMREAVGAAQIKLAAKAAHESKTMYNFFVLTKKAAAAIILKSSTVLLSAALCEDCCTPSGPMRPERSHLTDPMGQLPSMLQHMLQRRR